MCIPSDWRLGCLALSLCVWQSGAWCSDSRWSTGGFSAGSRERCNRFTLVEIKVRASEHCASEPSTAGRNRIRTNEPHVSRPGPFIREGRIEIVFRRDEGCGHHLTCVTLGVTTNSCMLLRRDRAAVIQIERHVFSQRSEWDFALRSW